ncbi:MAG: pyridoxal phosphate-dependent aminotransferase [Verrucomicrobiota bacterium]
MEGFQKFLSARALAIEPSPTLAVDAKAKALKAEGRDVCGFGAGEPDFDTPEFIKEACIQAVHDGKTKYAPAPGLPELREALAEKYKRDNGFSSCESSQVVVSPGGKYSCYLAIQAVCNHGDEVLIPAPFWVSYPEMVKLAGGIPKILETKISDGFCLDPDRLQEAVTEKTKLLILNSPSNPTGGVYPPELIRRIFEICSQHGILILSDEIYEYLLYDDSEHLSPASISEEAARLVITVGGFSKTFSMTGWRLGTLVATPEIAKAVSSLQSQTTSNATTFAQYGALAAMRNWDLARREMDKMIQVFDRRRIKLLEGLNSIRGVSCYRSTGAFYLFPDISALEIAPADFAKDLLEKKLVAVVAGEGFGSKSGIRLSYATSDDVIDRGLERLKDFIESEFS